MIFPTVLDNVTFQLVSLNQYHQIGVSSSTMRFSFEPFYSKEAITGRKRVSFRGVRFDGDITLDQTTEHDTIRDLYNDIYQELSVAGGSVRLYFTESASIGQQTDYIDVVMEPNLANMTYSNQVRRHSYRLGFSGLFPTFGLGIAYVIDNDGNFVFNNDGTRIFVILNTLG